VSHLLAFPRLSGGTSLHRAGASGFWYPTTCVRAGEPGLHLEFWHADSQRLWKEAAQPVGEVGELAFRGDGRDEM
jgi:hypothetical protein